jgi:hypothetical protein
VSSPALHPPSNRLLAYGLGQLDLLEGVALEAHLQQCAHCCARLDRLPADGLVNALRCAVRAPAAESGAARTRAPGSPAVPPELQSHPRYRVAALVGRGGMGTVYRAEHTLMGRPVALKVIDPHLLEHPGAVARFRQEVMAAARLSHPNIVIAYDAEQAGSHHFLVMEFVEGTNLADYLRTRGRLEPGEACAYVRQTALGLQHAFERGMVHRDIKPHNLMLTPSGEIKVLDFGLARFLFEQFPAEDPGNAPDTWAEHVVGAPEAASGLTPAGSLMGTLDYMAPEQARDARRADIRADIYSLGCTLYQLLTGQVPFPGGDARSKAARLAGEAPVPLGQLRPDLPNGLAALVARMMARRPEDRYQTPAAAAAALAPFTAATPGSQEGLAAPAKRGLPGGRKLLAVLGLALVLLTAGAVTLRLQPGQGDPAEETSKDRLTSLIRQLGDRKFAKREQAGKELEALGGEALPALRKATASDDPEIRRRADSLIRAITHRLARTDVKSLPPPKGAVVLFDGKNLDAWVGRDGVTDPPWKLPGGGIMEAHAEDIRTRQTFAGAYKLHVEFRIPANPPDTPVGRGNSGVYLHGRYEVQILDSFGPRAKAPGAIHSAPAGSCGAIYGQTAPRVNACKAPGFWQSYDIEFHPPRFKDGRKDEHPRVTVFHNGVLIHDNVHILVDDTGQGLPHDPARPGPVMLQYHSSPVQFRNVWLVPLKLGQPAGADAAEVKRLIRQLGSPKFKEREAAARRLNSIGELALAALQKAAVSSSDAEFRDRAGRLVEAIREDLGYLFNGKDLKGWHVESGAPRQWSVEGGAIVARSGDYRTRNHLLSDKDYADFTLRLEFRLDPGSGGGIVLRGLEGEKIVDACCDHPVLKLTDPATFRDYCSGTTHFLKDDKQYCRPTEDLKLPAGNWLTMQITVRGDTCTAVLAGKKIVDIRLGPNAPGGLVPGLKRSKGRIGFQAHTGTVRFRNISIERLKR